MWARISQTSRVEEAENESGKIRLKNLGESDIVKEMDMLERIGFENEQRGSF